MPCITAEKFYAFEREFLARLNFYVGARPSKLVSNSKMVLMIAMCYYLSHAGHSLGGGYSTTLLLHLLALKAKRDASLDQIHLEGAVTFGAPLTLVQAAAAEGDPTSSPQTSYDAAKKLLASCR